MYKRQANDEVNSGAESGSGSGGEENDDEVSHDKEFLVLDDFRQRNLKILTELQKKDVHPEQYLIDKKTGKRKFNEKEYFLDEDGTALLRRPKYWHFKMNEMRAQPEGFLLAALSKFDIHPEPDDFNTDESGLNALKDYKYWEDMLSAMKKKSKRTPDNSACLLYTSDAADD